MMTSMCILVGAVFGWLSLRSDSVWPAALAHGTFNAAAGFFLVFAAVGAPANTVNATILGWSAWIAPLAVVIVLVALGQFRRLSTVESRRRQLPPQPPFDG
ncbi:CPBP family glutamic-type intramembrane protease [Paeniglutamicibacter antarcticus]